MGRLAALAVILGITAALMAGYAAGARPPKGQHARCAGKSTKAKHAKRRTKCNKAGKTSGGRSHRTRSVGPKRTNRPPGGRMPAAKGPSDTATGTGTTTGATATGGGTAGTGAGTPGTGTGPTTATGAATGTGTTTATGTNTATTTGAPGAPSATVIVHVFTRPLVCCSVNERTTLDETQPLRIIWRGTGGEVIGSSETSEHTVHLAPGSYEIQVVSRPGGAAYGHKEVTLSAGQTQEVTFTIRLCGIEGDVCPE